MKIFNLTEKSQLYTSNAYLVLGSWNALDDVNTLIDTGSDDAVIQRIESINTGLGKRKVDQVILTHTHSDHTAALKVVKDAYNPAILAFNIHLKSVTQSIGDGDILKIGDAQFEVFHITAHSYDSVCLFCETEGILFSGDTTFPIDFENAALSDENADVLQRLAGRKVRIMYPGHGTVRHFTHQNFKTIKDKVY
jgi:Zn-dependent hydrolases, including glyoxylases